MADYYISPVVNGETFEPLVKVGDTLPIGTEVYYDGAEVPEGWEQVADPNEYSTTEQVIGKWINGKPLYRKVIDFGTLPNATTKSVPHNISNIDKITKIDGITYSNQNYSPLPLVYNSNEAQYNTEIYVGSTNIFMKSTQNRSSVTAFVYLEYTKTTD